MFNKVKNILTPSKRLSLEEFESLYLEHKEFVRNSIYLMVGGEVANELTQDTFVKAWKQSSHFRGESSFKTWIYAIAMNTAKDHLRRKSIATFPLESYEGAIESNLHEEKDLVIQAIKLMTVKQRELFILFYKFGYSYKEIAELTKIKEGTVKSRIQKAKVIFIEFMNSTGDKNER